MKKAFALLVLAGAASAASANIIYTVGTYGNTFDNLNAAQNTTATWTNDSTMSGWYLYGYNATTVPTYLAHNGTGTGSTTGSFISYGASGSTERALGGLGSGGTYFGSPGPSSGSVAGYIAVAFDNGGATALTDFTIGFNGEQWRNGGNTSLAAQSMVLEYGFGATFAAVTTWTAPGGNFDWTSTQNAATAAGVDGNTTGLVANRGGTISNITWNPGDTLWIRWIERNDAGNDHGLAIDNFSFSATPTPGCAALFGLGILASARRRRA